MYNQYLLSVYFGNPIVYIVFLMIEDHCDTLLHFEYQSWTICIQKWFTYPTTVWCDTIYDLWFRACSLWWRHIYHLGWSLEVRCVLDSCICTLILSLTNHKKIFFPITWSQLMYCEIFSSFAYLKCSDANIIVQKFDQT